MATVNVRARILRAAVFNGIDAGGAMTATFSAGYDVILKSSPDGLGGPPIEDLYGEFVRGRFASQDWIHFVDLLTGTLGNYISYERKSGTPEATGYIKHTVKNPVAHAAELNIDNDNYATTACSFECKAADETEGFADLFTSEDNQAAPAYIPAVRGGYRIKSAVFTPDGGSAIDVYHAIRFRLAAALGVDKASQDSDKGYTQVDVIEDGATWNGSLVFQDTSISSSLIMAQRLIGAGRGTLVITVEQGSGATDKVITVAGVRFNNANKSSGTERTSHTCNFNVTNSTSTPLTLSGANKIVTIADVT